MTVDVLKVVRAVDSYRLVLGFEQWDARAPVLLILEEQQRHYKHPFDWVRDIEDARIVLDEPTAKALRDALLELYPVGEG